VSVPNLCLYSRRAVQNCASLTTITGMGGGALSEEWNALNVEAINHGVLLFPNVVEKCTIVDGNNIPIRTKLR